MKMNNFGRQTLTDFQTHYKMITVKTLWYWHKERQNDQRNAIESKDLYIYRQLIFKKSAKTIQWQKDKSL